jgi:hypothetical protein
MNAVSHTFSPERQRRVELLASLALLLAAIAAVIVFLPAEGRLLVPLHAAVEALLGQATFVLPLSLALAGALGLVRWARPDLALPARRLIGLGLLLLAVLPAEDLLGRSTGLLGEWLSRFLIELLGLPLAVALLLGLLGLGAALTFPLDRLPSPLNRWRPRLAAR